jgi:hypothetical protein
MPTHTAGTQGKVGGGWVGHKKQKTCRHTREVGKGRRWGCGVWGQGVGGGGRSSGVKVRVGGEGGWPQGLGLRVKVGVGGRG